MKGIKITAHNTIPHMHQQADDDHHHHELFLWYG